MKYFKFRYETGRIIAKRKPIDKFYDKYKQIKLCLIYGPGAGYINGWTFYIAINCPNMRLPAGLHICVKLIQCGFTTNANIIPYIRS